MSEKVNSRNLIAFWIFGLTNNYAFIIMLTAAQDIISKQEVSTNNQTLTIESDNCQETSNGRVCKNISTGAVLLADVVPSLMFKLLAVFFGSRIPFGIRHFLVCIFQVISYLIVAYSTSINMSLLGVCFASASGGLGESCFLSLASHYSKKTISFWSSGTGGAGVFGSLSYAVLTEKKLFNMTPKNTLLSMLILPIIFAFTYWFVLTPVSSIHRVHILHPKTWIVPKQEKSTIQKNNKIPGNRISTFELNFNDGTNTNKFESSTSSFSLSTILSNILPHIYYIPPILRYMIPLLIVYYTEYLINQGIVELFIFNCANGFGLSKSSQYRWYQVIYQVGVFISRSSVSFVKLSVIILYLLPVLQTINFIIFYFNAIYSFIPHIIIIFGFVLFEGLFGGASYVNTFYRIYMETPVEARGFCMTVASLSDSFGIMISGLTAIPIHNYICSLT